MCEIRTFWWVFRPLCIHKMRPENPPKCGEKTHKHVRAFSIRTWSFTDNCHYLGWPRPYLPDFLTPDAPSALISAPAWYDIVNIFSHPATIQVQRQQEQSMSSCRCQSRFKVRLQPLHITTPKLPLGLAQNETEIYAKR